MNSTYKKFFVNALKSHFPGTHTTLLPEVDLRFSELRKDTQFAATSTNPMDRRLDFSAYFLAFIQVLEKDGQSFEQIKSLCLEVTYQYVAPKNRAQKWLKRLPVKLIGLGITRPIFKMLNKKFSTGHKDGFRARILTDKAETYNLGYGVDILECGICKLFQKHQAGAYASILCEVDKITSSMAGLELVRKGTIATGAEKCDFRFKKK